MKNTIIFLFFLVTVLFLYVLTKPTTVSGFQNMSPAPVGRTSINYVSGPADSMLNPRIPYHLLQGVLEDAAVDDKPNTAFNAQACYESDFANRIQLTGNFNQLTNNYRRKNPDSCSAPVHELVNNFYKPSML
jgi:hypothetical protein